jgi:tRNA threonylcarbamoyladenosine biosynthesis protein TsaB
MRILAIETVGVHGSIAGLEGQSLLAEHPLDTSRRSAQTLAPGIAHLLAEAKWRPRDVELVAVATGPGSFTGLRVGVTTAKVFAWTVGCPVVGIHTLLAIAARTPIEIAHVAVTLDAQRGELFVADFQRSSASSMRGEATTRLERREDWLARLSRGDWVTGPGLESLADRLPQGVGVVDRTLWSPSAAAVGRLAIDGLAERSLASAIELLPRYYRATAAEEKLAARDQ